MFSEVRNAILPLALRRLQRRGDLERAGLLIESLGRHWRDTNSFELLIVAPNRDADLLRAELPRVPNIVVTVRPESDFFGRGSRFYLMPGWYRQQIIKLQVPVVMGFEGYLTLDSDVVCVGDFDSRTFVVESRALSRWEPKSHQTWWRPVADLVGVPYHDDGHGLSVTPNILHGDLSRQALMHFSDDTLESAITRFGMWSLRKIGQVAWTEYSLYTSVAELKGNLLNYHVDPTASYGAPIHLFSERSCVWGANDFERMASLPYGTDPGGKFIIVQSVARIPIERVRQYCLSFAG